MHTRTGNSLIVNTGLSDLAVSIVIFPISIISLLAMSKDEDLAPLSVCKFQWFLAACTFLISVLTLTVSSWTVSFNRFETASRVECQALYSQFLLTHFSYLSIRNSLSLSMRSPAGDIDWKLHEAMYHPGRASVVWSVKRHRHNSPYLVLWLCGFRSAIFLRCQLWLLQPAEQ